MNEPTVHGTRVRRSMTDAERGFWGEAPVMRGHDVAYSGHLRAEVWADGLVCLSMSDARFIGPALAALMDPSSLNTVERPLPDGPVMMDRPGVEFLGRAVVDFWTGRPPVAGTIGADSGRLVSLTTERLKQIS